MTGKPLRESVRRRPRRRERDRLDVGVLLRFPFSTLDIVGGNGRSERRKTRVQHLQHQATGLARISRRPAGESQIDL